MSLTDEKTAQEGFEWARSAQFSNYNTVLGEYQAKAVLEHARGRSLLDMPCGDGTLTAMLAPAFDRVVGLDASSKHLAQARLRLPDVEFHEGLIEEFAPSERFDTVSMINVLEHVIDPVAVLQHAMSLVSDTGVLIVHVPNALAINRRLAVLMGTLTEAEELSPFDIHVAGHRRSYSLATLSEDVTRAGLKVSATGGVFYKMLSTPQIDWFLAEGPWAEGGFGWGRVGAEPRDWRAEWCRACYELGNEYPEDCNVVYVVIEK